MNVHLDTDIGDDIDDVFCLALLLQCPELTLRSCTTVFGHTDEKATIVEQMCDCTGAKPAIAAGFPQPIASRPMKQWLARPHLYPAEKPATKYAIDTPAALRLMTELSADDAILTIGAMTNLAAALVSKPADAPWPRVVSMAAEFQRYGHTEFNVRCDPEAAHLCFTSGVRIDFIPWSIGPATKLLPADIERLRSAETPLCKLVVSLLETFWKSFPGKTNMYDPMTVVALLRPDLFDWRRGTVHVELRGEHTYGLTTFNEHSDGPHRVAFGVQAEAAKAFLIDRLTGKEVAQ